jgi:hypothetical protein
LVGLDDLGVAGLAGILAGDWGGETIGHG